MITRFRLTGRHPSRSAKPGPPREPPKPATPSPTPSWGRRLLPVATLVLLLVVLIRAPSPQEGTSPRDHREALDTLAELLTTRETVDGSVVLDVLRQQRPDGHDPRRGREEPTPPA